MLPTVLNIRLHYIILYYLNTFFFQKKKKNLCPEWDLNCCTPAWRSELLPTGLLGSVNRCWLGVASTPHSNVWGNKIGRISKTKAKIKNPEIFFLIRSRATCTCKIKPWNASYDLKHYITLHYIILFKFFEIFYLVCNYLVCNFTK